MQGLLGLRTAIALGILIPALRGWIYVALAFVGIVLLLTLIAIWRLYKNACLVSGAQFVKSARSLADDLVHCPVCNATGQDRPGKWWVDSKIKRCFFCLGRGQVARAKVRELGL